MPVSEEFERNIIALLTEQLPPHLCYHNAAHTAYVMNKVRLISSEEVLTPKEKMRLEAAALFHDTGFLLHHKNHEALSCAYAREALPEYGFDDNDIEAVCCIIMATAVPSIPKSLPEKIIRDADLYYLGTDEYEEQSQLLYKELKHFNPTMSAAEWKEFQLNFLQKHQFNTKYGREKLEARKQVNIDWVKNS